jgi:hypothetical protein
MIQSLRENNRCVRLKGERCAFGMPFFFAQFAGIHQNANQQVK